MGDSPISIDTTKEFLPQRHVVKFLALFVPVGLETENEAQITYMSKVKP